MVSLLGFSDFDLQGYPPPSHSILCSTPGPESVAPRSVASVGTEEHCCPQRSKAGWNLPKEPAGRLKHTRKENTKSLPAVRLTKYRFPAPQQRSSARLSAVASTPPLRVLSNSTSGPPQTFSLEPSLSPCLLRDGFERQPGSSCPEAAEMNLTRIHEDAGSIPGLAQ